jgi:hypothetical protein
MGKFAVESLDDRNDDDNHNYDLHCYYHFASVASLQPLVSFGLCVVVRWVYFTYDELLFHNDCLCDCF